ncbi:MAG: transporter substrate-binding domain-containing protein, partial [Candidatus Eremiobacteraeota bacterium]|nr:transporter substrate-binding domain-containing protein [Candidatus Eremiobacteraeota bacterium]
MTLPVRRFASFVLAAALGAVIAPHPPAALAQTTVAAPAQDALSRIRQSGVLRVGLTGDYDPFSLSDKNGEFRGVDVDAARMLAAAMGPKVRVEIVKTSWPSMTADLLADKFDIAMGGV